MTYYETIMRKDGQKIIFFSIIVGISTWMIDALVDSWVFAKGPFWTATLIGDTHELYMRFLFMAIMVFFGVLITGFVARRRKLDRARIAAEQALRVSEDRLRSVMESIADSIYLLDADCRYVFMNKKHIERLGLSGEGYLGRAYGDFHSPEETGELIESVDTVFKTGDTIQKEHFSRRDNRHFLRTFSPVKSDGAGITAVAVDSKDVSELKELADKLRNLSLTDELTGLYNRRGLFTLAEPLLKLACRNKNHVFLLYADLDNLKKINDVLGHHEGDNAIIDTAHVLKAAFRETDIIARIGGDEFVVIPVAGNKTDVDMVIARFREHIRAQNEKNGRSYTLSISLGLSGCDPEAPCTIDDLLKRAEKLMYEDKALKQKRK